MDERFELIIDVQSRGIRATEKEIESAQEALDALNREGKVAEKTVAQVTKSLDKMSSALKDGYGQQKQMNAALETQNKALRERESLARKQGAGADKSISSQWDAEFTALNKSVAANKQAEAARATASREAVAGIDRMSSAYDTRIAAETRLNSERAKGFQSSKQQMAAWDADYKALSKATEAQQKLALTSPSLRYALYDVAQTATIASAAITGLGMATVAASASYERSFANVERTLQPGSYGVETLRGELLQLSREIPVAFGGITEIATLGNQLGLSGDQVAAFTETVAQFSAVSGVSANETALAFGQLDNLLPDVNGQFDRLGSSIALVGVNSAATESQIIGVAREIAPAAAAAGFAAHEVIGLSGALGSLKVPPERSRSTILQFFETLNMATAEGGEKLENFARVVGVTSSDLEAMVRSGQGRSILERFIGNVSTSDSVQITQALQELGLAGLRTNPTIRALAGNMDLLNTAFADGERGWTQNSELARQYEIIVQTLSAQWQLFLNGLMEFAAAVGNQIAPALKTLLELATGVLNGLSEFASSPFGGFVVQAIAAIAAFAAGLLGLVGATAASTATLVAFRGALLQLNIAGATSGLAGLVSGMFGLSGATGVATSALKLFRVALVTTGIGALVVGIGVAIQAGSDMENTFLNLLEPLHFAIDAMANVAQAAVAMGGAIAYGASQIPLIGGAFSSVAEHAKGAGAAVEEWRKGLQGKMNDAAWAIRGRKAADELSTALGNMGYVAGESTGSFNDLGKSVDKVGNAAGGGGGAAQKIRTLLDYASDLAGVWSRAFEIRFSGQSTLDTLRSSFISIQEATEASARAIAKLKAEISGLQSDLNIQQYFLGIALEYKDYARAEAIQANIAKLQADMADKQASLTDEQGKNSKVLTGNSKAAIANRKSITDLVSQYQAHIQALAASGMSQDQLALATQQLQQDFYAQATQLGYNRGELDMYAAAFNDVAVAINNVPRNITVTANVSPALQALNEYEAKLKSLSSGTYGGGTVLPPNYGNSSKIAELEAALELAAFRSKALTRLGNAASAQTYLDLVANLQGQLRSLRGYSSGGYTGAGGKMEPAGIVHRGEYVVPKKDVNQRTGLPYADALGRLQKGAPGRRGYAGGGYVSPGGGASQLMYLAPATIQQLAMAMEKYIVIDNRVLAETSSTAYATSTAQGAY